MSKTLKGKRGERSGIESGARSFQGQGLKKWKSSERETDLWFGKERRIRVRERERRKEPEFRVRLSVFAFVFFFFLIFYAFFPFLFFFLFSTFYQIDKKNKEKCSQIPTLVENQILTLSPIFFVFAVQPLSILETKNDPKISRNFK